MDAELAALASSGATTVVGLMVSDAWGQVRDRVAGFFARGSQPDAVAAAVADELQVSRQELLTTRETGDAATAADVEALWRTRLRHLLQADPAAVQELRALLLELAPAAAHSTVVVHNSVSGGVQYGPVVQAQEISGLTVHAATPPRTRPPAPPPAHQSPSGEPEPEPG